MAYLGRASQATADPSLIRHGGFARDDHPCRMVN
jgi:hypothetical protein